MSDDPTPMMLVEDHGRAISTWILSLPVGALLDPPGKEGLAYLTGQLLLRGAGGMDQARFADELDLLGSTLNVGTGRERTTISGDALTRHVDDFEHLVAAMLSQPALDAEELEKLKRQTVAELSQVRDNDAGLGQRFFLRRLFADHPYGRPVKGTEASIPTITIEDVRSFFSERFVSDGALLGASGDVDTARLAVFAGRTAGALPQRRYEPPVVPPLTTPEGYRVVLVDKPERSQTQVFIGHITLDTNHPDYLPLLVAQTVFGGTFTARISHEIREKRGWSYGAYSYLSTDRHLGTFTIRFYPSVADTLPAMQLADEMFRDLVANGVTDEELAFARDYLANGHAFSIDTAERRLSELMSARLQGRPDGWVDGFVAAVREVTPAQVDAALRKHLTPESLVTCVLATASDFADALKGWPRVTSIEQVDYRDPAYP